jgi:hypothetical protein
VEKILYAVDSDPTGGDQPADDIRQSEALRYGEAGALVRRRELPPVAADGTFDAQEGRQSRRA